MGSNRTMYHDEIVSAEIGQVGTQFDGLGHIGVGDLFYNGNDRGEFSKGDGLTKLGVENVGPLVTRGVLVDVAAFKGVARLEGGYEITLADLRGALERQRTEVRAGDVVLVHTGWGSLWGTDNAAFARERARRRPRGRAVSGRARGRARRLGHVGDGGRAESESRAAIPRAPAADTAQRDLHLRESR